MICSFSSVRCNFSIAAAPLPRSMGYMVLSQRSNINHRRMQRNIIRPPMVATPALIGRQGTKSLGSHTKIHHLVENILLEYERLGTRCSRASQGCVFRVRCVTSESNVDCRLVVNQVLQPRYEEHRARKSQGKITLGDEERFRQCRLLARATQRGHLSE